MNIVTGQSDLFFVTGLWTENESFMLSVYVMQEECHLLECFDDVVLYKFTNVSRDRKNVGRTSS